MKLIFSTILVFLATAFLAPHAGAVNLIHGTVVAGTGTNTVNIVFTANYTSATGEYADGTTLAIAIPTIAGEVVTITGVGNYAGLVFSPQTEIIGSETVYEWQINQLTPVAMAWTSGVPFTVATVTFGGPASPPVVAPVRLVDRTNATAATGNGYFAVATNKGDMTDYGNFFYAQAGASTTGTYANGDSYAQTTAAIALPVTLTSFTGVASGCTASLAWMAASEQNSSYYAVEAGLDGASFTQVGKVASKNSASGASYTFSQPLGSGITYFRLKMVDKDGASTYSSVVAVTGTGACATSLSAKVSPNPTSNMLNIQGLSANSRITVLTLSGQKLTELTSGGTSQSISLSNYASGVYIVRIQAVDGTITNVKVVKQ